MKIPKELLDTVVNDYKEQNITRLAEWFRLIPDVEFLIRDRIGGGILKQAIIEEKWLLTSFLMKVNVSEKGLQAQHGMREEHWLSQSLVKANLIGLDKNKMETLAYLQERVKI